MKKLLCIAVVAVGSISSAMAQAPATGGSDRNATSPVTPPSSQGLFETLDKNSDGKISMDEAKASSTVAASFQSADKNGDGALTKTEFGAYFGS